MPHSAFTRSDHRPWPYPNRAWSWRQSWRDLLFLHWPVPAAALRPLVPPELEIQEFDGTSWVGVVPFRMAGVMRRPLPDLPWVSAFPELNVRLYVKKAGEEAESKPGVWFLSLDATNLLAVWAARRFFHLPYYRAQITVEDAGDQIRYDSVRRKSDARFRARYGPTGPVYAARAGALDHWLTERYCLYALDPRGRLLRNEVHHVPWPLQPARAEIEENAMLHIYGIQLEGAPLCHFARRIDVVVWDAEEA
ncbi:MAG: DUF2071 domain-containing protein [Caldilineaceae bacterium]|nr:DUF2071 domain-containing protein [Caldilineaceae bacterium]